MTYRQLLAWALWSCFPCVDSFFFLPSTFVHCVERQTEAQRFLLPPPPSLLDLYWRYANNVWTTRKPLIVYLCFGSTSFDTVLLPDLLPRHFHRDYTPLFTSSFHEFLRRLWKRWIANDRRRRAALPLFSCIRTNLCSNHSGSTCYLNSLSLVYQK